MNEKRQKLIKNAMMMNLQQKILLLFYIEIIDDIFNQF